MSYVLILGAKSDIARAVARVYAGAGYDLFLAARGAADLDGFARDIMVRTGRDVRCVDLDILDFGSHGAFYQGLGKRPGGVIAAVGYLGDQARAEQDFDEARTIVDTNYTGLVSLLNIVARDFEQSRSGFMVVISSVAGDRGRKSNYLYGSAKAALTAYLSGLRNRLQGAGVQVLTVKPGFVATKMTAHMKLPGLLTARPETVAKDIYRAQTGKKDVLYTLWVWRWIMLIIRCIPEGIFKKLNL